MATDLAFAGALIDNSSSPHWSGRRVLGKRLRKFCLWHRLLLGTVDSPFTNNSDRTLRDVRIAIGICRTRFGDSRIRKPILIPALIWLKFILWSLLPRRKRNYAPDDLRGLNPMQRAIMKHSNAFLEYCGDYLQDPKFAIIPPETNGTAPRVPRGRAPAELEHASDLINWAKGAMTEQRVWEMPFGLANWYRVMAIKSTGADVDFMDKAEQEFTGKLPPAYRWRNN
jgi:hypothetical protein